MKPAEVKAIRQALGLSQNDLGRSLGLRGENVDRTIRNWETGARPITGPARIALAFMARDVLGKRAASFPVIEIILAEI